MRLCWVQQVRPWSDTHAGAISTYGSICTSRVSREVLEHQASHSTRQPEVALCLVKWLPWCPGTPCSSGCNIRSVLPQCRARQARPSGVDSLAACSSVCTVLIACICTPCALPLQCIEDVEDDIHAVAEADPWHACNERIQHVHTNVLAQDAA